MKKFSNSQFTSELTLCENVPIRSTTKIQSRIAPGSRSQRRLFLTINQEQGPARVQFARLGAKIGIKAMQRSEVIKRERMFLD